MSEERFTQVEKTYTYCSTTTSVIGNKTYYYNNPCAFVQHTIDGKAIYHPIDTDLYEVLARDEAHTKARQLKHSLSH
jgi:hypothetical protein